MINRVTLALPPGTAKPSRNTIGQSANQRLRALACARLAGLAVMATPAQAVDGCQVLLCFAASNWREIPQCVPTMQQVLRDLARGRPFPTCNMPGAGNSASHQWASAPDFCPPQYTRINEGVNGPVYSCDYDGAVAVNIDGALWARTWWRMTGDSVTEFSAQAKARMGSWDSRFDADYALWLASLPPPATPCPVC